MLGAEEGQIATYNGSRPTWLPIWAVAKFKRDLKAASLPGGADTLPRTSATATKKAKEAWRDKFRNAVLVAKEPAHRTLWKQYQQMCRR